MGFFLSRLNHLLTNINNKNKHTMIIIAFFIFDTGLKGITKLIMYKESGKIAVLKIIVRRNS